MLGLCFSRLFCRQISWMYFIYLFFYHRVYNIQYTYILVIIIIFIVFEVQRHRIFFFLYICSFCSQMIVFFNFFWKKTFIKIFKTQEAGLPQQNVIYCGWDLLFFKFSYSFFVQRCNYYTLFFMDLILLVCILKWIACDG